MIPGMPGAVLTTLYYLLLVAAMPVVVAVRAARKQPTQAKRAAFLLALTAGCVAIAFGLWQLKTA